MGDNKAEGGGGRAIDVGEALALAAGEGAGQKSWSVF